MVSELELKDGTLLPYEVFGEGEPVIFIHGLFGKAKDYKEVIEEVSKEYCCIALDLRGHGNSKAESGFELSIFAEDLNTLINYLKLKNPVIVGYSTGALTLFSYIERYGCENLKKLIFVDITPKVINNDKWNLGLYRGEYTVEDYERDLVELENNFLKFASFFTYRNMTKYNEKSPYKKSANFLSKILARMLIGKDPKKMKMTRELWREVCKCDFRNTLEKINIPTAFFYADPGSLFTPETAEYLKSSIHGNGILVPFKDASHAVLFSHGKQFIKELTNFLHK